MAKIEKQLKVILSKEEVDTLKKTQKILVDIGCYDNDNELYTQCDNFDGEWLWIDSVLENLIKISEVE